MLVKWRPSCPCSPEIQHFVLTVVSPPTRRRKLLESYLRLFRVPFLPPSSACPGGRALLFSQPFLPPGVAIHHMTLTFTSFITVCSLLFFSSGAVHCLCRLLPGHRKIESTSSYFILPPSLWLEVFLGYVFPLLFLDFFEFFFLF